MKFYFCPLLTASQFELEHLPSVSIGLGDNLRRLAHRVARIPILKTFYHLLRSFWQSRHKTDRKILQNLTGQWKTKYNWQNTRNKVRRLNYLHSQNK